jgi:hypothetical protein
MRPEQAWVFDPVANLETRVREDIFGIIVRFIIFGLNFSSLFLVGLFYE